MNNKSYCVTTVLIHKLLLSLITHKELVFY